MISFLFRPKKRENPNSLSSSNPEPKHPSSSSSKSRRDRLLIVDTNVLIQLFIEESFSALARTEISRTENLAASSFAFLEAVGALGSMQRASKITRKQYKSTVHEILRLRDHKTLYNISKQQKLPVVTIPEFERGR
jgi:hypothetical protein